MVLPSPLVPWHPSVLSRVFSWKKLTLFSEISPRMGDGQALTGTRYPTLPGLFFTNRTLLDFF